MAFDESGRQPKVAAALRQAADALLAQLESHGHWTGELSASALSTATAVCALITLARHRSAGSLSPPAEQLDQAVKKGLAWLTAHANPDGGWGDTLLSHSNLSTTTLVWAALRGMAAPTFDRPSAGLTPTNDSPILPTVLTRAEAWLGQRIGRLDPISMASAIIARYGEDRTFSVPILTLCAIMGGLGEGSQAWQSVIPLPFELATLPSSWYAAVRLPVVSYALPALIAMGYAHHHHAPSSHPILRWLRRVIAPRALKLLTRLQPPNGGFLEATPLTSFVVMSLAASGQTKHPVVLQGTNFILASQRPDGSWPIDTNLATWLTTLSVNALVRMPSQTLVPQTKETLLTWLLNQQFRTVHPYTQAAPGGWAWTDLPGGVPDADDTAGALLAIANLAAHDARSQTAAQAGIRWLLGVQNRDGGIPTFCRGWGKLPFDRSSADLTAHALRAWLAWKQKMPTRLQKRLQAALQQGSNFLLRTQHPDGFWLPLWFGNQFAPDEANPVYGTSRVILALADCCRHGYFKVKLALIGGLRWLMESQHPEGGWGGSKTSPCSIEETALAIEAISNCLQAPNLFMEKPLRQRAVQALADGCDWLCDQVATGQFLQPAPIGFYFSKLWYYEKLYPLIFTVNALASTQAREQDDHR